MINFTIKPCVPDGINTIKIAKSILKRCFKRQNKLESLLQLRFTSTIPEIDIKSITDFPKLSLREIRAKITLGSFKIRQCQSYMGQIINYSKAFYLENHMIDKYVHEKVKTELRYSKIISVLISSRHKRGLKTKAKNNNQNNNTTYEYDPKRFTTAYKVFIQYIPVDSTKLASLSGMLEVDARPYKLIKS